MVRMTPKQRRFAEVYLETGDAGRAALAAGYRTDHPSRLLESPGVKRCLAELSQPPPEPEGPAGYGRVADAEEVLEYLTNVLRGEAEPDGRGSASSPRMKAAELLGKRLGIFSETVEGQKPPVILDDIPGGGI